MDFSLKILIAEKEKQTDGLVYVGDSKLEGIEREEALSKITKRLESLNRGINILTAALK